MLKFNLFQRLTFVFFSLFLALSSTFPVHAQGPVAVSLSFTSVTIDTGVLIVKGTISCSEPATAFVHADASEQVGNTLISGSGDINSVYCDPSGATIIMRIGAQTGAFQAGRITVVESASVCAPDFSTCLSTGSATLKQTFKIKRA